MENEPQFKVNLNLEVLKKEIVINSQDDFLQAGDVLKLVKNKIKEVDEERKSYTNPLEQSKKRLIAKAKEIIKPLEDYIAKIDKAMSAWHIIQEAKRKEEEDRIEAERQEMLKKHEEEGTMPTVEDYLGVAKPETEDTKTTRGSIATTSMVEKWEFEIINPDEVERQFCSPDERLIRKAIADGVREIKGIRLEKTFKPTSR